MRNLQGGYIKMLDNALSSSAHLPLVLAVRVTVETPSTNRVLCTINTLVILGATMGLKTTKASLVSNHRIVMEMWQ